MKNLSQILTTGAVAVAAASASAVFAPQANAALLFTNTASFSGALTELTGSPVLTVNKFTIPTAGFTNYSVKVTLAGSLTSSGTVTNVAAQAQSFTIETRAQQYNLVPGAGAPAALTTLTPIPAFGLIGSQAYTNLAVNATAPFGAFTASGSTNQTFTGASALTFSGPGTLSVNPFTTILTSFTGGGGNLNTSIQTVASADLTIEYFADPIPTASTPEPSSVLGMLAVAGFAGAAAARRRKS